MYKIFAVIFIAMAVFMVGCTKPAEKNKVEKKQSSKQVSFYVNETAGFKVPISKSWIVRPVDNADLLMTSTDGSFSPDPSVNIQSVKQSVFDLWDKKNQAKLKANLSYWRNNFRPNPGLFIGAFFYPAKTLVVC